MSNKINSLTSLRFFAAFLVFSDHFLVKLFISDPYSYWSASLGYLGINFFFILSGFVLAHAYLQLFKNKKITAVTFYMRRLIRLWPLHVFTILIVFPWVWTTVNEHLIKSLFYLAVNLTLLQDFIPHSADLFNSPSWSISAEMFFSLCFPLLIALYLKNKKLFFLGLGAFFGFVLFSGIILSNKNAGTVTTHGIDILGTQVSLLGIFYVLPPFRLLDFYCGIALYQAYQHLKGKTFSFKYISILEVLTLVGIMVTYVLHQSVPLLILVGIWFLPLCCFCILVFSLERGCLAKILNTRICVLLGECSFAFYMLQVPLYTILHSFLSKLDPKIFEILHLLLLLLFSYLVHRYFELPSYQYLKKRISHKMGVYQ